MVAHGNADVLHFREHFEAVLTAFTPGAGGFTPPNGWRRSRTFWVLTNTMPASMPRAGRNTLLTSCVQMYDARPYSTSFARRKPSASSLNGSRQATGPKISSGRRAYGYLRLPAPLGAGSCRLSGAQAGQTVYPGRPPAGLRLLQCRDGYSRRLSQCCWLISAQPGYSDRSDRPRADGWRVRQKRLTNSG